MADVLSRIDAGHALDTQFIATTKEDGSGYGREMTTIKRNELMKELKASAINNPIYKTDASGRYIINPHTNTPEMISVSETSNPDEWREYRNTLKNNPEYTVRYNNLHTIYKNVQKNIKSNQNKQSLKSTGQYVANSVAIAATTM